MSLEPGQNLLHYRLIDKIGQGGMGVVWRAEDTSLHREIAIKILPEVADTNSATPSSERLDRFAREARLLATLNHPNIASVYGLHEVDGVHFLAMELVRGEDLSERIRRGPLPLDEALPIARSIAEGVATAHATGVIHRDLKPANIRLGPDGEVKVLDFGLAKALSVGGDDSSSGSPSMLSPTVTSLGTVAGVLLGTAAYMSPEQARGRPVDRRADIWAFGCVLYEMLAGGLAFPGETITDTLAAVVRGEPDWQKLPGDLPRPVERVLRLCLAKNPKERLNDVGDALLLLDEPAVEDAAATTAVATKGRFGLREGLAWALALAAVAVALVAGLGGSDPELSPRPIRFPIELPPNRPLSFIDEPILAFSPDGTKIAFSANDPASGRTILSIRALDQNDPWTLPGTEGATSPFFSPDGESLGFFSGGELKRIDLGEGMPVSLAAAATPRGGAWLTDGTIVYSPTYGGGLWQVSETGGAERLIVEPDADRGERTYRWPIGLPDGKTVLFTVGSVESPNNYDQAQIAAVSLTGGEPRVLIDGANMVRFAPPDRLIFKLRGNLYAVRFDPDRVEVLGEPVQVADGIGGDHTSGAGYFDLSAKGDLVSVNSSVTDARASLVVVDREQNQVVLPIPPSGIFQPEFSPDGSSVVFSIGSGRAGMRGDIWRYTFADQGLRRMTFGGTDFYPIWRDDGTRIGYVQAEAKGGFRMIDADGGNQTDLLVNDTDRVLFPGSWSAAAGAMTMIEVAAATDIVRYDEDGGGETTKIVSDATSPMISPDGRWLAYHSPSDGVSSAVFVESLNGSGKWQVSGTGGVYPRWSPDGRKLFFLARSSALRSLMEVEIDAGDSFRFSMPKVALEDTSEFVTATAPAINWDTDGERFIFVKLVQDAEARSRIDVSLDWARGLTLGTER